MSFVAVAVWFCVFCPLTGKFIACLLPLYVPISFSLMIFCCIILRASLSMVICESSAVRDVTVRGFSEPHFASLWMENLARIREEAVGPRA